MGGHVTHSWHQVARWPADAQLSNYYRKTTHSASIVWLLVTVVCIACGAQRGTVGVRFGRDTEGQLFAREVPEGLGAANAGVRPGDQVLLIEGRDVRPLSDTEIHELLSGGYGSRVRITVLRDSAVIRFAVERTQPRAPLLKR